MTRIRRAFLVSIAVLLSPMAVNADLIVYEYSGIGTDNIQGDDWTMEGSVFFDDASLVPGVNLIDDIVSWDFSWTNGTEAYSLSNDDTALIFSNFWLNADLSVWVLQTFLCSDNCFTGGPSFTIDNDDDWFAVNSPDIYSYFVVGKGGWTGPNAVSVHEPGTLALFGIGLFGIGAARRRKA